MPYRSFILLIGLFLPLSNLLHAQSTLALSSAAVPPGGATALNLSLSSDPSNQPAALEWTFSYPTASVATLSVDAGPALSAAGKSVSCSAGANSYTCVAWGLNSNPISDGVVATVSLTLSGSNSLPVAIDNSLGASLAGDEIAVTGTGGVVGVTAVTGITSLTCAPGSLAPNASSTCTATLDGLGGGVVGLSSSTANLTTPASLTIPTGSLSGTFTATATAFTTDQGATVTGTLNGSTATANLALTTLPTVSSLQCASGSLAPNASTTCTVTLSKSTAGSNVVTLANSAPSALTVPPSVTVAANATSATFTASTGALASDQSANVTATLNGTSKSATLSLTTLPTVSSLQCSSGSLAANASTTCTVTLSKSTSSANVVTLSNSAPSVLTVPPSVSVAANATSATFTASTGALASDQSATLTATLNGSSQSATLSLTTLPTISSLQCTAASLASNASTTCTVTLSKSAAISTTVTLSNSLPSVLTVPPSVSVAANATSATFTASTGAVAADQSATVTAALNGSSKSVTLSLTAPLTVSALQCTAASLGAQASTTCTVTLSKSVTGSTVVTLSNSAPSVLTVSPSVSVPANSASATFTASTGALPADQSATITATLNGSSKSVTLSLTTLPAVSTLQCAATTLASSASTTCTVTLTKSVTTSTAVTITNSAPAVLTVPTSVNVAANAASATFTASTGAVPSDQSATVTAALNGSSQPVTLSLTSPMTVSSLQCTAASLPSNASTTCTVRLSKSATRDTMVTLSDNAPSALTVPSAAHVAPTSNSSTFTVSTGPLAADQSATVTATFNGTSAAAIISLVAPATLSGLQCAASSLASNASTTCTVTLSKTEPSPVTISLTSSLPSLLTVPGTFTIPANSASASFTVSTATIATAQGAVIAASLGATNLTANISLAVTPKPLSLTCTPVILTPGITGSCGITLGVPATSPTLVTLLATNTAFLVPTSITIPTGATSGNVQFTTTNALSGWVILLATSGNQKQAFSFSVPARSMTSTTNLESLACSKRIASGLTGVCELRLSPSASSQTSISLTSNSSRLRVPENVQAEAGQTSVRFEVAVDAEASDESAVLEARTGDSAVRESLDVVSSGPHVLAPGRVAATPAAPVRFRVSATGSALITATGLPRGSVFDTNSGDFEWNPLPADQGEHEISFIATDALGARTVRTVVVYVGTGAPVVTQLRNMAGSAACSPGAISSVAGWFLSDSETPLADPSGRSASLNHARVLVNGDYAPVLSASAGQIQFLCPSLPAGTPLDIAVETPAGQSSALRTTMEETVPAILTVDGAPQGHALATHANSDELAALPNFRYRARPALSDQLIYVWATGIECAASPQLRLNLAGQSVAAESLQSLSQMAGVCQIAFRVPANVTGDSVSLSLEVTRSDAKVAISNRTSVTVQPLTTEPLSTLNLEEKQ